MSATSRTESKVGREAAVPLSIAAMLVAVEAALVAPGHLLAADIVDAVLLLVILQVRAFLSGPAAVATGALALIPLIRVVGLGLPLRDGSDASGTLVVAILVGSAALAVATGGYSLRSRMTAARPGAAQLWAWLGGSVLGLVAYLLGAPALWPVYARGDRVFVGLVAAACAAVVEEVVFRGVIQRALERVAGASGRLATSALFASTYLATHSAALVLTLALAGVVFAYVVTRTGSLGGAIGGHLLLALGAGGLWPAVLGRAHPDWLSRSAATIVLALALVAMSAVLLGGGSRRSAGSAAATAPQQAS